MKHDVSLATAKGVKSAAMLAAYGTAEGEGKRLSGAAMTSLVVHASVGAALFLGLADATPAAPPPAAMVVEIASLPSAPPVPPSEAPPQPEQEQAQPKPVANKLELPPIPKLAFNVKPAVTVPTKEPEPENKKQAERPAEETTRAAAPAAPPKDEARAPTFGAPSKSSANAEANWNARIQAAIQRKLRYPATAKSAGQQGTPYIRLSIDRSGRVVGVTLRRPTGNALIDAEAVAVAQRAGPYPKPPAEVAGDPVLLLLPVEFVIRPGR